MNINPIRPAVKVITLKNFKKNCLKLPLQREKNLYITERPFSIYNEITTDKSESQSDCTQKKHSSWLDRSKKNDLLKYKKLIKLKRAVIVLMKKIKISRKIFSKKKFVKTMHRKRFDYPDSGKIGVYPLKPIHIETSYRLTISIFLFPPQKLSLLSPFWDKGSL